MKNPAQQISHRPALRRLAAAVMLCCAAASMTVPARGAGAVFFRRRAQLRQRRHGVGDQGGRPLHRHDLHHRPAREGHPDPGVGAHADQVAGVRAADLGVAPAGLCGRHRRRLRQGGAGIGSEIAVLADHGRHRRQARQGRPGGDPDLPPQLRVGRQPDRGAAPAHFAEQLDHGQPGQQQPGDHRLRRQLAPPRKNHRRARRAGRRRRSTWCRCATRSPATSP